MPELALKMRMTPKSNSTRINGTSHHFFSRTQKRRNSLKTNHMNSRILTILADTGNNEAGLLIGLHIPRRAENETRSLSIRYAGHWREI